LSLTFTREEKAKTLKEIIHIDDRSTRVFPVTPIDKAFLAGVISKAEELVKLANNSGGNLASAQMNSDVVTHIRGLGSIIFNQLLHSDVQSRLKDLPVGSLLTISLELDSSLLQVPWELAWDSSSFLSSKFAVGRQLAVSSCHSMEPLAKKEAAMLIIVDPTATLTSASTEADVIRDHIPDWVDVAVMTQEDVRNELDIIARLNTCRYDIIHFAGHSVFSDNNPDDTGWVISLDGTKPSAVLPAARFKSLPKENRPRLVFSNSCNAAVALDASHTAAYSYDVQSVGVGSAFLHNKVPAYIGTLFTVRDKSAAMFAGSFYEHLFSGQSMGEAMRLSRGSIIETHSPAEITWASYVLYGNPSDRLCR
jgi:CHAT domain-containing protein